MAPAVRPPSNEALRLARQLILDPGGDLRSDDAVVEEAAARVARELNDYDQRLLAEARRRPPDAPGRLALEQALGHRITVAEMRLTRRRSAHADR
jgi:hypothetical protein